MTLPTDWSPTLPEVALSDAPTTDFADELLMELDTAQGWPLPREIEPRAAAAAGRALRKNDVQWIKAMHGWDTDRDYVPDSLAKRIAKGWADFLFAEDITITAAAPDQEPDNDEDAGTGNAAADAAQAAIDEIIETARMPALLHRAERKVASEGESYWKLHVNRSVAPWPLLTFCSRLDTVPLFYGDRLLAAAFVTVRYRELQELPQGQQTKDNTHEEIVYRHAEIHADGRVVNVLYRGTNEQLGRRVPLDTITQTAGYEPEWQHGLPMLAGRVVNDLDDDDTQGVGEYDGITDMLFALNEAVTIAVENARLTGQDRIFAAGRFMQADGSFDASLQVFQLEESNGVLGEGETKPPITAIEKKYDAVPLWLHITNLTKSILNKTGLVPQWVGEEVQGAESGLAIRLRFIPTVNAAKGKTREWAHVIPTIVDLMLRVADLPVEQGGFGTQVAQDDPPAVEFADPIPTDQSRDLLDVAAATDAQVMSRHTAIATLHPEWTDTQIEEEMQRIKDEMPAAPPILVPPPTARPFTPPEPPSSIR